MKQRTATEQKHLDDIASKIRAMGAYLPLVVTVTEGKKIRTEAQNARYWSEMDYFLSQINETVHAIAEHTGYTVSEVRALVAQELSPEQKGIVYALSSEAAHETMKEICGIPTSTRLGTKSFMQFEERLEQVMSEIVGTINAVKHKAMA